VRDLTDLLENVGFIEVQYVGQTNVSTSACTVGALFRALSPSPGNGKEGDNG
jgi:hypothetical protein